MNVKIPGGTTPFSFNQRLYGATGSVPHTPTPLARSTDPDESHAAAARVPSKQQAKLILSSLHQYGDQTQDELAQSTGIRTNSVSPRVSELLTGRYIHDTGVRRDGQRVVGVVKGAA